MFQLIKLKIPIYRPFNLDEQENQETFFGYVINSNTLDKQSEIGHTSNFAALRGQIKTTALLKYRDQLLWLRQVSADVETLNYLPQAHISVIDFGQLETESLVKTQTRKILLKNDESTEVVSKVH